MVRIRSPLLLTMVLVLAVLTGLSGPALAGPSGRLPVEDTSGGGDRLAGNDSPNSGFGLNRLLGQRSSSPPAIHICKLAGALRTGTPVTLQLTGTHNGEPTTVTDIVDVGTVCRPNEFVNFGNQFDLNTTVSIVEIAPTNSRILPGPPSVGGCQVDAQGQGGGDFFLPCTVSPTGVATFFLDSGSGGGQIDVVL